MNTSINFKRLLEIESLKIDDLPEEEKEIVCTKNTVYIIYNDKIGKAYIGETISTYYRLFKFWKKDKRHVTGENSPLQKHFSGDYENTYFMILEENCDNKKREYYWHDHFRNLGKYIIVSHPGRHGCTRPGNIGLIAIHKGDKQMYINKDDLEKFIQDGWEKGGKKNRPRTQEQKERISKSHLGQSPWNKGRSTSEEAKKKQSEAHRKKGLYRKPDGTFIEFPKASINRHHPNWIFIKDI